MTQGRSPAEATTADQLIQRLRDAVTQLEDACGADAEDLRKLRDQRKQATAEAERSARASAERELATVPGLTGQVSLGSRLRAELTRLSGIQMRHTDSSPPSSLDQAIAEWQQLSAVEQRVQQFLAEYNMWNARLIKRPKLAPQAEDSLWQALDRLDQIHRAIPSLREAFIVGKIREAAQSADASLAAEIAQRNARQARLARDVKEAVAEVEAATGLASAPWDDPRWDAPAPASAVERFIRLGEFRVAAPEVLGVSSVPAVIAFPFAAGIAVGSDVTNRERTIGLLRALILRLFAGVPPGAMQIKVIDPVSLGQSVAEFRHLSEYDTRLMDEKTWTTERDVERLMDELSDHLETVISRYLRGQFDTIDEYNRYADEVAQPYRVLVVFDYPEGFSGRASRQLLSLIENGPRCGVYTILHYDQTAEHRDVPIDRLIHSMQKVQWRGSSAVFQIPGSASDVSAGLLPDQAAPVSFSKEGYPATNFAVLLTAVGEPVRDRLTRPPAVTLGTLLPVLNHSRTGVLPLFEPGAPAITTDPATWWTASSAEVTVAPMGRSGAQGITSMHFSSTDVAGGAIMVGLPRSGKTTSLHSIILTLSMLYPPDELELYLIDAKHGVEFKIYENLPHARMVSVRSDREFSLAVLRSIEQEIQRRAELMKAEGSGRANLTEYREATGAKLPRVVVIIDEFHELFEEPDRLGQDAFAAFSNIVRMGPFSGVHIVVASQTLSGMPAMDRPTLMLLPQRVAFMCNEYDAELVMGETNKAARFLSKIGEGLFNPSRGEESKNQPFQGLYIPADERAHLLRALSTKAAARNWTARPRVFDGDAWVPRTWSTVDLPASKGFAIPLGEPFSLADREAIVLRRTRGANVLLLGDIDDDLGDPAIRGALHSFMVAARQQAVQVTVIDFIGDEDDEHGLTVIEAAQALGAAYVRSRRSDSVLRGLAAEIGQRLQALDYKAPRQVVILFGLQRALSFSPHDPYAVEQPDGPSVEACLATVLKDGPDVGIHTVISADRVKTIELRLGSDLLPEFTFRVLGSAADQQDVATSSGQYGDVMPLQPGQLLITDQARGTAKRIRGYSLLTQAAFPVHGAAESAVSAHEAGAWPV
ncbi:MAG: FtsK/SpoIIIE domain-containing protein [Streptosporangiaceae bacterium]